MPRSVNELVVGVLLLGTVVVVATNPAATITAITDLVQGDAAERSELPTLARDEQEGRAGTTESSPSPPRPSYELVAGGRFIQTAAQTRIRVVPRVVDGYVDYAVRRGSLVEFGGWAADVERGRLPDRILAFANGRLLHAGSIGLARADLAPEIRNAGFVFALPVARLVNGGQRSEARFFAVSDSVASELRYLSRASEWTGESGR
jgi:hypothetical protein